MSNKTIIESEKQGKENSASMLRKFSRRVKDSGVLRHVRKIRYMERVSSDLSTKRNKLRKIEKQKEYQKLYKLGKINKRGR